MAFVGFTDGIGIIYLELDELVEQPIAGREHRLTGVLDPGVSEEARGCTRADHELRWNTPPRKQARENERLHQATGVARHHR
jgi:hypothetical protein